MAADQPAVTTQTGKFNSLSLNAQGRVSPRSITKEVNGGAQAFVLNVAPTVTVVGNAALLENGHAVELTLLNGVVISIKVV